MNFDVVTQFISRHHNMAMAHVPAVNHDYTCSIKVNSNAIYTDTHSLKVSPIMITGQRFVVNNYKIG